jgi:myo-inositol-1(or 4)-monophosphatase
LVLAGETARRQHAAMPRRPDAVLADALRRAARLERPTMELVRRVAAMVHAAQRRLRPADVRRKGVGDFVTAVDVRAERQLRPALAALLPEAGFLGEESDPSDLDRPWIWVVDPIDGTSNFARGLPHFAVSVALLFRGQPVLAVVHAAPERTLYVARHGAGARRDGRRLRAPAGRLDDGAMIGCQWFRGQQQLGFVARLQRRGGRIRTLGSTVTQLADVAAGRLDANVQEQGRVWDIAAAGLVAVEAGCRFTDWRGRAVFPFRSLAIEHVATVAATPSVHRGVLRLLRGARAVVPVA